MVVYNYPCNQYLSPLTLWVRIQFRRGVLDTLFYKNSQWLAAGRWFSPGSPVSSTNKTDHYDITEILLKVPLTHPPPHHPQKLKFPADLLIILICNQRIITLHCNIIDIVYVYAGKGDYPTTPCTNFSLISPMDMRNVCLFVCLFNFLKKPQLIYIFSQGGHFG